MNLEQPTRRRRPVAWSLVALALIALVAWRTGAWTSASTDSGDRGNGRGAAADGSNPGLVVYPPEKRTRVPDLEGTTLDGDSFKLSDWAGNIVVINVWASWCGPCRAETPDLVRLAREYDDRGVQFLGIDTRDNLSSARAFVAKFKVPYPSLFDEGGRALLPLRGIIPSAVIPSTVVVDRHGKVAARVIGPVTYKTLNGVLEDELAGRAR